MNSLKTFDDKNFLVSPKSSFLSHLKSFTLNSLKLCAIPVCARRWRSVSQSQAGWLLPASICTPWPVSANYLNPGTSIQTFPVTMKWNTNVRLQLCASSSSCTSCWSATHRQQLRRRSSAPHRPQQPAAELRAQQHLVHEHVTHLAENYKRDL